MKRLLALVPRAASVGLLVPFVLAASLAAQALDALGGRTPERVADEVRARFDVAHPGDRTARLDAGESCLSPLVARLRAAAPDLAPHVRSELAALDPNVALALDLGLADAHGVALDGGLPSYPELDLVEEGVHCIVHYTLSGEHAVVGVKYPEEVRKLLDKAHKLFAKKAYREPYCENDGGPETRLHVYLAKLPDDPVLGPVAGFVQGVDDVGGVSGQPRTVYMALSSGQVKAGDATKEWKRKVRATCVHEFMHCIQYAYNHALGRWMLEGQAVWAENRVAKVREGQLAYLELSESILRATEKPLWEQSIRMYSTSPLLHYADLVFGKDAPKRILEGALVQDDPILVLQAMLAADGETWDEFYKGWLARLWYKDLPGLPKKTFPEITLAGAPVSSFGWEDSGEVSVTGFRVHLFGTPSHPTKLLFARVSRTGSMAGTPSGVLLHGQQKRLSLGTAVWDDVDDFTKGDAVLVATDTAYTAATDVKTPYRAEVFAPYLEITGLDEDTPIGLGGTSTITFTYDLLGTPVGVAPVPIVLHVQRKGPCCPLDQPTFPAWQPGTGQTATYTFFAPADPAAAGTYAFKFFAKVPTDAYGGEHVRSIAKTKIKVVKP